MHIASLILEVLGYWLLAGTAAVLIFHLALAPRRADKKRFN